jgi:hypothetical protein
MLSTHVGTVVVQFTTVVVGLDVDFGEITLTGDLTDREDQYFRSENWGRVGGYLHVVGGLDEMGPGDRAGGHDTSTVTTLEAPSNFICLTVTDRFNRRGCPQAKVVEGVEYWGVDESAIRDTG